MTNIEKGKFIVFEGLDGCGKGTQIRETKNFYEISGKEVIVTCEHTRDLPVGKLIEETVNGGEKMDPLALQLCFTADRVDHYKKVIEPALNEGKIVISDRYYGSTVAYTEDDKKELMLNLNESVVPRADLTIILDVDAATAMNRIEAGRAQKTIFEKLEKQEKCRQSYVWFANKVGDSVVVVNGLGTVEEVRDRIIGEIKNRGLVDNWSDNTPSSIIAEGTKDTDYIINNEIGTRCIND